MLGILTLVCTWTLCASISGNAYVQGVGDRLLATFHVSPYRRFLLSYINIGYNTVWSECVRLYTKKVTPYSVVTNLFHDCERSLWLFCVVWHVRAMIKVRVVHLDWQLGGRRLPVLRVCAMFDGLTEFLFRISIWFSCQFAGFQGANRAVTRLLLLHRFMKCLAYFCSEYSRARPSTRRSGQVIDSVCRSFHDARGQSAVCTQPWLLQCLLGLGLFVARCALVRNGA